MQYFIAAGFIIGMTVIALFFAYLETRKKKLTKQGKL